MPAPSVSIVNGTFAMATIAMPSPAVVPPTLGQVGGISPQDLLEMDGLYELVDGELREKHTGFDAGDTTVNVTLGVGGYVKANGLGKVVSEVTFQCFPLKPNQVRRPDVAFVATARLPGVPRRGNVPIRPDLVIEVTSPEEKVVELDGKLADYHSVGVPLVWVFNPELRIVRVYRPDGSSRLLTESDTIDGGDVLPGFSAIVRELLPAAATT
jgi:Uma2 family endonuclease